MDRPYETNLPLFAVLFAAAPLVFASPAPASDTPGSRPFWVEHFEGPALDWVDIERHRSEEIARVYGVRDEGPLHFLHAHHDGGERGAPRAIHYGKVFDPPARLADVRALRWRWRAVHHPAVTNDPWEDLALGIYVVMRAPSLLRGGRGFKFGWLAKPGPKGEHQGGLLEVELRHEPASGQWRSESVDLCKLFETEYGNCSEEVVRYIGVTTDGDGTRSLAEGDYTDFELAMR